MLNKSIHSTLLSHQGGLSKPDTRTYERMENIVINRGLLIVINKEAIHVIVIIENVWTLPRNKTKALNSL